MPDLVTLSDAEREVLLHLVSEKLDQHNEQTIVLMELLQKLSGDAKPD